DFDAAWPIIALQPVEPAADLEVADQNDSPRSDVLPLLVRVGERFRGRDKSVAKMSGGPGWSDLRQPIGGERSTFGHRHRRPLFETDQRMDLPVEGENR